MQFLLDGEKVYVVGDDNLPLATLTIEGDYLVVQADKGREEIILQGPHAGKED